MGDVSTAGKNKNRRKIQEEVLLMVPTRIFGHPIQALIDGRGNRGFTLVNGIKPLELSTMKQQIFLELGDGQKSYPDAKCLTS